MTFSGSEFHPDLARLKALADSTPNGIALRHKQRGAWYLWHWRDVAVDVRHLAGGLQSLGFTAGDSLAISGEFGPHLLLIGLAVRHLGGTTVAVAPDADVQDIADLLASRGIRHVFTQGRQNLTAWLQVATQADIDLRVIFDHATSDGKTTDDRAITFDALRISGGAAVEKVSLVTATDAAPDVTPARRTGNLSDLIWVEESTRWRNGLDVLLCQWLDGGLILAFPESLAAAARDRREIVPKRLLISAERLEVLYEGILRRLPAEQTRLRRLIDRSILSGGAFRGRWNDRAIAWLIRRPLGLRRLREIAVFPATPDATAAISAPVRRLFAGLAVFLVTQVEGAPIRRPESEMTERNQLAAEILAAAGTTNLSALANG